MAVSKRGTFYHYRFMLRGRLYRGSTKESSESKARKFEAVLMTRILEGGGNALFKKSPRLRELAVTFLKFVDETTEAKQLDADTQKCYHSGWRLLKDTFIADMRIDEIGSPDAEVLKFPGSASNGNMALRTLRRMLGYACETKLLRAAATIKLLEEHGREALMDSWVEELFLALAPDYLADTIVIMLDCGMRPEEVCRMRWEHIHWDKSLILVPHGKSLKARRWVGMTDRMRARMRVRQQEVAAEAEKMGLPAPPWVFPSHSESGHRVNMNKAWGQTYTAVELKIAEDKLPPLPSGLVLYCARHTFATEFLANGGELTKLSYLLGHASVTTTMKYVHNHASGASEVMDRHNQKKTALRIVKRA